MGSHNLSYRDKKQPLGSLLGHLQMIRKSASELGKAFALRGNVSTIGNDSRTYSQVTFTSGLWVCRNQHDLAKEGILACIWVAFKSSSLFDTE